MAETVLLSEADPRDGGQDALDEEIAAIVAQLQTELADLRKLLRVNPAARTSSAS